MAVNQGLAVVAIDMSIGLWCDCGRRHDCGGYEAGKGLMSSVSVSPTSCMYSHLYRPIALERTAWP